MADEPESQTEEQRGEEAAATWKELAAEEAASAPKEAAGEGSKPADPVPPADDLGTFKVPDEPIAPEPPAEPAAPTAPTAPAGQTQAEADAWAAMTPEQQRKAYETAQQKLQSNEGRVKGIQRRYEELRRLVEAPKSEKNQLDIEAKLAKLREDYPEIATPLQEVLAPIAERLQKQDQADEDQRAAATQEMGQLVESEVARLDGLVPDWRNMLKTNADEFRRWIDDQPRADRDAFSRNAVNVVDAEEASSVLLKFQAYREGTAAPIPTALAADRDRHQQQQSPLNDRRTRQLGATLQPDTVARRPVTSGIPEEGDPQAIWDAIRAQEARASSV